MAILKSLFPNSNPVQENKAEDKKVLSSTPDSVVSEQEEQKMDLSKILTYAKGAAKGKPATWVCGTASIPAPKLKKVVSTTLDFASTLSEKEKGFLKLMDKEGKSGKAFLEAIDAKDIPYIDVIEYVNAFTPTKGRAAADGAGSGKQAKFCKAIAKACAVFYKADSTRESLFSALENFIEQSSNQESILKAFHKLAEDTKNEDGEILKGVDEDGYINLRKLSLEGMKKAQEHGAKMGAKKKAEAAKAKKK